MLLYRIVASIVCGIPKIAWRVRVVGREHLPASGAFVVAPTHRSMFDIPFVGGLTSRRVRFMGKAELFRIPVAGAVFRALGGFPVERDGSDRKPLRDSLEILEAGEPLVVYPEGTRQNGSEVQPLQPGAAYLATKAQVPIVPVGIAGSEEILRSHSRRVPAFGRVAIVVGEPITPPTIPGKTVKRELVDEMTAKLSADLQRLLDEAYRLRDGSR